MSARRWASHEMRGEEFKAAVAKHEASGAWWRAEFADGGFAGYPLLVRNGSVVIAGAGKFNDTLQDKRNGRLNGARWVQCNPSGQVKDDGPVRRDVVGAREGGRST